MIAGSVEQKRHQGLVGSATQAFAKHEIVHRGEGRWIIKARKDSGSYDSGYWTEIVCLANGAILACGDIEPVMFGHYGDTPDHLDRLRWMGQHPEPDDYVVRKAKLGTGAALIEEHDAEVLRDDLRRALEARRLELAEECDDPLMGDFADLDQLGRESLEQLAAYTHGNRARLQELGIATPLLPDETDDQYCARIIQGLRDRLKSALERLHEEACRCATAPEPAIRSLEPYILIGHRLADTLDVDELIVLARGAEGEVEALGIELRLDGGGSLVDLELAVQAARTTAREALVKPLTGLYTKVVEAWVQRKAPDDPEYGAWGEALDTCDELPPDCVFMGLHDATYTDAKGRTHAVFEDSDAFCDMGKVTSARVYFAHAAVRRLWQLLEAEKQARESIPAEEVLRRIDEVEVRMKQHMAAIAAGQVDATALAQAVEAAGTGPTGVLVQIDRLILARFDAFLAAITKPVGNAGGTGGAT